MKTMDIKHGELNKTIAHDADTIKRHREFDLRLQALLEQYVTDVLGRYREILTQQDNIMKRNPIHYGAMNKFTRSQKTLETMLDIDMDRCPGFDQFLPLFFQVQGFEMGDEVFDPRKSSEVLKEFRQLMNPRDYNQICSEFKQQVKLLLREVLNQQDVNYHSPLHIASYFGSFQAARTIVKLGCEPHSAAFPQNALEIGKDKYTRQVLQNLNKAAS